MFHLVKNIRAFEVCTFKGKLLCVAHFDLPGPGVDHVRALDLAVLRVHPEDHLRGGIKVQGLYVLLSTDYVYLSFARYLIGADLLSVGE